MSGVLEDVSASFKHDMKLFGPPDAKALVEIKSNVTIKTSFFILSPFVV
jgi:hypothetical protein